MQLFKEFQRHVNRDVLLEMHAMVEPADRHASFFWHGVILGKRDERRLCNMTRCLLQILEHRESWSVSAWDAIKQIFARGGVPNSDGGRGGEYMETPIIGLLHQSLARFLHLAAGALV